MNSGHAGTYLPGSLQGRTCTWTRFVANADKDFEVGPKTCMLTCNAAYVKRDCKIATCPCTQVQLLEPFMEHRILFYPFNFFACIFTLAIFCLSLQVCVACSILRVKNCRRMRQGVATEKWRAKTRKSWSLLLLAWLSWLRHLQMWRSQLPGSFAVLGSFRWNNHGVWMSPDVHSRSEFACVVYPIIPDFLLLNLSRKTSLYARASVGQERLGLANRFIVNVSSSLPLPWVLLPTKCRRGCGPPSAASDRRPRKVVMQHLDPSNTGKLASCHFVDACCMAFFWRK